MWQIWIDTGGTFTDGVALAPDSTQVRTKILSTAALRGRIVGRPAADRLEIYETWAAAPDTLRGLRFRVLGTPDLDNRVRDYDPATASLRLGKPAASEAEAGAAFELLSDDDAPLMAARLLTGTPAGAALPPATMRLATTRGTNTLLTRSGAATALFVTRGFGDVLEIGTQQRPELFTLAVDKPAPLYTAVVEVDERLDRDGGVVRPLALEPLAAAAMRLVREGVRTAAVALMHAYRNPEHETRLRDRLLAWGFEHVSCSADLAPRIKLLPRAETAVVNAYLSPAVGDYFERVQAGLATGELLVMSSSGGLLERQRFRPKDGLLSGPAGGVCGAALAARRSGFDRIVSFDMGGTSTDVARFDGGFEYVYEQRVGDAHLVAPALAIETVAAGGGSVCRLEHGRLRVGPQSAGAHPGPACYGAGGPLTLTDVNLLLGRLDPARFSIPIDPAPARERLAALSRADEARLLEGLLDIADETMADAIRRVSLRRGYDPATYTLVAFGGAGGQHVCGIAERLDMRRALVPRDASLLSAHGLGGAALERFEERQVLEPLTASEPKLGGWFNELERKARRVLGGGRVRRRILHLRFSGQESSLEIDWSPELSIGEAFAGRYRELYGHDPENRTIEVESMRVLASLPSPAIDARKSDVRDHVPEPAGQRRVFLEGRWQELPVFDRERVDAGGRFRGPAIVFERQSVTFVRAGWSVRVDGHGALLLERRDVAADTLAARERPEAIRVELFTQRFTSLVREMGERLERTAVSTNVKERLDFSCALLDPRGELVVNAPHIPVHLGALGLCVRRLAERLPLEPGDVAVTNHPAYGGSHLPDVTVVTPVFTAAGDTLLGYVASRAHHAEIGGSRPGSMPPAATCLAEEGVVLPPMYLARGGRPDWEAVRRRLVAPPFPSRNVEDNLADLRAAVAANHAGAVKLREMALTYGADTVRHYMDRLERMAESAIREALGRVADGRYAAEERLDDGTPLCVAIELAGDTATIDFSGTAGVHAGNLNATPAIVRSAVIYVLRLLVRRPLPLNEGLMRAVTLHVPRGLLDPDFPEDPRRAPAVVGGNVETSQRLVDTLLRALGIAACSQGTMNNLIFGNARYGYYETLGGGCGAVDGHDGASGVHSHMTNTRITDPELLEHRYPVRVERFAIRRGSGGGGRYRGGNGLIRELRFLDPASLSVLTQHRNVAPYGLEGGEPGACGRQRVLRATGEEVELGPIDGADLESGDRLVVETPGGGGFGASIAAPCRSKQN